MERYSQFRDRGSGIAPFFPIPTESSGIYLPFHVFLFLFRLPLLITLFITYFLVLQWLPIGSLGKKAALWAIIGTPGLWWVDLQMDAIKKGTMSTHKDLRFQPGSVIAASLTSPLDALYLAAIFDPVFTASYPSTRLLERISLLTAILRAFSQPQEVPPKGADLIDIPTLVSENPGRFIVVFPECTTTNGRGILRLSQSLLTASTKTKIWPMSLRYTPADITTPVPKEYLSFLWNLLSKPTHSLRVRVAQSVSTLPTLEDEEGSPTFDVVQDDALNGSNGSKSLNGLAITVEEHRFLDKIAETLARLGRNKRLGLGVREKQQFVEVWSRHRRR